jgi:response regulator RpfG family c-di-GMP phosphodiesterase
MTGIEFLKRATSLAPQTVRIIITGYTDAEALVEAINSGVVYKYVTKPWINSDLKVTIQRALQHHEAQKAQRNLQERYTRLVGEADEARSSIKRIVGALLQLQDPPAYVRAALASTIAADLARVIELPRNEIDRLELAIFVRAMLKATESVRGADPNSRNYPSQAGSRFDAGVEMISEVPFMRDVVGTVREFTERYDGTGLPGGLLGEAISPIARIGAIVTAYDEMTTRPSDKPALQSLDAVESIKSSAGTKFDPMLVDVFCSLVGSFNTHANQIESVGRPTGNSRPSFV